MTKAIDKIQGALTGQCKTLEEKVSSFTVDNVSMDTSSSTGTGEFIISSVVNPQAAKPGTSNVFGVLKEHEDHSRKKTSFLIYNLPEPIGSNCVDRKMVESLVQKNLSISEAKR